MPGLLNTSCARGHLTFKHHQGSRKWNGTRSCDEESLCSHNSLLSDADNVQPVPADCKHFEDSVSTEILWTSDTSYMTQDGTSNYLFCDNCDRRISDLPSVRHDKMRTMMCSSCALHCSSPAFIYNRSTSQTEKTPILGRNQRGVHNVSAALALSFHEILPRTSAVGETNGTANGSEGGQQLPSAHADMTEELQMELPANGDATNTANISESVHVVCGTDTGSIQINNDLSNTAETETLPVEPPPAFSIRLLTHREKLVLLCLVLVDLSSQMCLSIMAPFFPTEASNKNVSSSLSGWIFGVFALVQFMASPLFGKVLPHFGSRFLISSGQFFSGGCILLFGFLDRIGSSDDNTLFIAYCFILRIFLAIGCTASATASFAVTANVFPNHIATAFGLLETASGLGMMVGPAVGGVLYQAGGFYLPFVALGSLMILTVPLNYLCLPATDENRVSLHSVSLLQVIRIPAIIVVCLAVIVAALVWSILDPTLTPHIEATGVEISSSVLGLLFLLMSAFYAVFSPIWGWMADRMDNCSPMLAMGFIFSGIGLLLLGPSPLLNLYLESNDPLWMNIIALSVLGVSASLALVPTFDKILDTVEKAGIEDSFAMYSIVAGIWGGCYALGDFIGPALGGWLDDRPGGFVWCVTYTAGICFLMAILVMVLWFFESHHGRSLSAWFCHTICPCVSVKQVPKVSTEQPSNPSETLSLLTDVDTTSLLPPFQQTDDPLNTASSDDRPSLVAWRS